MTAERHRRGLESLGHSVAIVETLQDPVALEEETGRFRPDLIHLLHAYRSGGAWLASPSATSLPMAVTLTGTDIHEGIHHPEQAPVIEEVLARAGAVITQNPLTYEDLFASRPALRERLRYLPPGVVLGDEPFSPRRLLEIPSDSILFLHPAGIRPVKRNLELLRLFDDLSGEGANFTLAFCGPVLDDDYGELFLAALSQRPWARYLGVVPPAAMAAVFRESDTVLNHSVSEGMPTALLEGTVLGIPILASAIPGNAAVVEHGRNGLLYRNDEEFVVLARQLLRDPLLRRRLSVPHLDRYRPEKEAAELCAIYRQVLSLLGGVR